MQKNDKKLIVERELAKLFPDPAFRSPLYEPDSGFAQEEVEGLRLFTEFDRYTSGGLIEGGYGDRRFAIADVCITVEREEENEDDEDSDDDPRAVTVTLFKGPVLRFTLGTPLPGPLRVVSRRMEEIDYRSSSVRTSRGKTRVTAAKYRDWTEVTTEAQPFTDEFLAFAPDAIAGMRILKPQVIEKMLRLAAELEHPMMFLFEDTEALAFLHRGKETFALSAGKTPEKQAALAAGDAALILKFLDGMKKLLPDSGE